MDTKRVSRGVGLSRVYRRVARGTKPELLTLGLGESLFRQEVT